MRIITPALFLLLSIVLVQGCLFNSRTYTLYLVMDKGCKVDQTSIAILDGKEVGKVKSVKILDSDKVIMELSIKKDARIPASYTVKCWQNLLGTVYIDISRNIRTNAGNTAYYQAEDTLYGSYVSRRQRDSVLNGAIHRNLQELKGALDSVTAKDSNPSK
jgi:ABC-type transporter Mla subunit MlaD